MEKLLLIGLPQTEEVEKVAKKLRIRTVQVLPSQYTQSVGMLAGYASAVATAKMEAEEFIPEEGLLVMCGLKNAHMNKLLEELRHNGLQIPYKAVMTTTNLTWNALQLAYELKKEHKAMHGQEN